MAGYTKFSRGGSGVQVDCAGGGSAQNVDLFHVHLNCRVKE